MNNRYLLRALFTVLTCVACALPAVSQASIGTPLNLAIVGSKYTNDTTPTFTWSAPAGATWYEYRVDSGAYIGLSNVLSVTLGTQGNGWHNFSVRAHNLSGEVSTEATMTYEIDTVGPTVPTVTPSAATEDVPVTFSVTPYGEAWTTTCTLYVGGASAGLMTSNATGTFTKVYTFLNDGNYSVYALCTDGDGNTTLGSSRTVTVANNNGESSFDNANTGDLIKTATSSAVYYVGSDNHRHPFPNEDVYYSWYTNFNNVITVSSTYMSSLTMGDNVHLKPGTAALKFTTSDDIYAVAEGGVLRHYLTPALVASDYGSDWSTQDLVVMPDVFFGNYTVGAVIDSAYDYDPSYAEDNVTSIDDDF